MVNGALFPELLCAARLARRYREPLPQREGRDAQYWADQMVAARDAARKAHCHFMMMAALRALDHSGGGH